MNIIQCNKCNKEFSIEDKDIKHKSLDCILVYEDSFR